MKITRGQFENLMEDFEGDRVYHTFVSNATVVKDQGIPQKVLVEMTVLGGPLSQFEFIQEFEIV